MTRRKPVDVPFEDWTRRLVREAQERGEFSGLAGEGRPIPDLDKPWSAERWVADLARREGLDLSVTLPAPLRLRREREQLLGGLASLRTEAQVREVVDRFNDGVREAFRRPSTGGPPMTVGLMDVEAVVDRWRAERAALEPAPEPEPVVEAPAARPWWRRWLGSVTAPAAGGQPRRLTRTGSGADGRSTMPTSTGGSASSVARRKRCSSTARPSVASSMASWAPTQAWGPAPNGNQA